MKEDQAVKMSREQLYNELWEISAVGVSKKYGVTYAVLLRICRENDIPIPPSGYWTQLRYGKSVSKTPLAESTITEVILSDIPTPKRRKSTQPATTKVKASKQKIEKEKQPSDTTSQTQKDRFMHRTVEGKYNTYNRDKLYEEVWTKPVVEVALHYGVSDVAIHKICKSLNIPVPPRGYWAKHRSGEILSKPPLPPRKGPTDITGIRSFEAVKIDDNVPDQLLAFLPEDERQRVLLAAQQISMPDENAPIHNKIKAYKLIVKEWNKNDPKPEGAERSFRSYGNRPPFLAGVISNETLPRVYRILDALFRQVENLGGSVNDDLSLKINNETVRLEIAEGQDEIKHELTREEAQKLIVYEDEKRRNSLWASQPQIRKYDYVFNGRLRISIRQSKYFRDTEKAKIESRLGDMLIDLYEESEVIRIAREEREEAERKRREEARLREERQIRYNQEIKRTIELENKALDYERAFRIRAYVKAVEEASSQDGMDDEKTAWIDWAKKKADWFDPTIARDDEYLGKRKHEQSQEQKEFKKDWRYW